MSQNSGLALPKENYKFIIVGLVVVILGFILMGGGGEEDPSKFNADELFSFRRITLAPFMVMAGYGVILFGILKKPSAPTKVDAPVKVENNDDLK
jgi:hypothetical protein